MFTASASVNVYDYRLSLLPPDGVLAEVTLSLSVFFIVKERSQVLHGFFMIGE